MRAAGMATQTIPPELNPRALNAVPEVSVYVTHQVINADFPNN